MRPLLDGNDGVVASESRSALHALFLTLRGRLVLLICLSTIPALISALGISANERGATLRRLAAEARHVGYLASREHATQMAGAKQLLLRLSPMLSCSTEEASRHPDYFRVLLAGYPHLANIGVLSMSGNLLYSAVPVSGVLNMASNPAFKRALRSDKVEIGSYMIGPIVGRPVLHMAFALRNQRGHPCAVAFVALELGWLDDLGRQAALPDDHVLVISDRNGVALAGSGALPASSGRVNPTEPLLARALAAPAGVVMQVGNPATSRFFVATPMDGLADLFVVTGLPYELVQREANWTFYRTLAALALVTSLTLGSALFAADFSVIRVLRTLTRTARQLGKGDLSSRAPLPGSHGELRELASSFNSMADALAARDREASEAQNQLRALSHRLQEARDTEASRIARELHDELGQVLTSLKLDLSRMRRVCHRNPHPSCANDLAQAGLDLNQRVDGAIDFIRRIASELRPTVLDRLGLAAALDWLAHEFETNTGLTVVLQVRGLDTPVDDPSALALFRIVQEALTNVARHASASQVEITLDGAEDRLLLTIKDDGVGIDLDKVGGRASLGLLNMKERTNLVGGTWRIEGAPGRGTTIKVELPFYRPPAPDGAFA